MSDLNYLRCFLGALLFMIELTHPIKYIELVTQIIVGVFEASKSLKDFSILRMNPLVIYSMT